MSDNPPQPELHSETCKRAVMMTSVSALEGAAEEVVPHKGLSSSAEGGLSSGAELSRRGAHLRALVDSFRGTDVVSYEDLVDFVVDDLYVIANVVPEVDHLRIRVYLPVDDEGAVKDWVDGQSEPRSGLLQAAYLDEGQWRPRLVFERPTGAHDWFTDPMFTDVERYARAWADDVDVVDTPRAAQGFSIPNDPQGVAASSAWLLTGDDASYPTADDLSDYRQAGRVGVYTCLWTTAAQARFGDLVLIYFVRPRKAVHFVARAASNAFFTTDIDVNAQRKVSAAQWWGYLTAPIEIEPIPVGVLQAAAGHLPLKGKSGRYLSPQTIAALPFRAVNPADQPELDRIVTVPVGLAELPAAKDVTIGVWRELPAGALPLEAHVSAYLVEPLLREVLADSKLTWTAEYPVGKGWADFVILDGQRPIHVIEVKKVINQVSPTRWHDSPDYQQLRRYAEQLGTPGTLIDSHRVVLFQPGHDQPVHEITRHTATDDDLHAIRAHILNRQPLSTARAAINQPRSA